jgi:hypothetical protein
MSAIKPRKPNSIEEALSRLLTKITPAEASKIIGKSESLIRKASDPNISYCLSVKDAIALDAAFESRKQGEAPIATMYARLLKERLKREDGYEFDQVGSPLENLSILTEEIGDVAHEMNNALKDSAFSSNEIASISNSIEDAINQLLVLKASIS